MIKKFLFIILLPALLSACSGSGDSKPQTDLEVANAFIRNLLDNKFKDAEKYLLPEPENKQYLDLIRQKFNEKSADEKERYRSSNIIINETSPVNDSVSIINYSNSYKKETRNNLKLVRKDGQWLVDFKYTFSGNM